MAFLQSFFQEVWRKILEILRIAHRTFDRFGEQRAAEAAAGMAFYGFFSMFPLLLILVTYGGVLLESAEAQKWLRSAPGKFVRGMTNMGLGWMNLFSQTAHSVDEGENLFVGLGKGFGYTAGRTVQGAVEMLLFWVPSVEDEPLRHCALGDVGWTGR